LGKIEEMSSPVFLTFYRTVNMLYAIFGSVLGAHHLDIGLILSSVVLAMVDLTLLVHDTFDPAILQPLRFLAATLLGPYWIYKGKVYNNVLLMIFGLSFVVFDGVLFLKDHFTDKITRHA